MPRDENGSQQLEARDAELSAYLDGELDPAAQQELRQALAESPALAERLARLRRVDEQLRQLSSRPAPADLGERLRARIAAEADAARPEPSRVAAAQRAPSRRTRWLLPGLAAAAAAALVLVVLPRLRGEPQAPPIAELREEPAPSTLARETDPSVAPGGELEPSPLEIATALVVEEETDLDVIEMLDWLEELGELEESGRG